MDYTADYGPNYRTDQAISMAPEVNNNVDEKGRWVSPATAWMLYNAHLSTKVDLLMAIIFERA